MSSVSVLVLGLLHKDAARMLSGFADFEEFERENPIEESKLVSLLKEHDAVIAEPLDQLTPEVIKNCPRLKMVSNRAVGYDNVNIDFASQNGILVTNTPGVLDAATADLAIALLLAVSRRLVEADKYVRDGHWQGFKNDLMLGPDLFGKTIGIVGLGRIGLAFARRARAFGLNIIYTREASIDKKDESYQKELNACRVSFEDLLTRSDFISLHCPYNKATHHLIGDKELKRMKPNAILINTSRGRIIDQPALIKHLEAGNLFGAGLDVFADEPAVPDALKRMNNVVLTPHIGSACTETRQAMTNMAVEAVIEAYSKRKPQNLVNQTAWNKFVSRLN